MLQFLMLLDVGKGVFWVVQVRRRVGMTVSNRRGWEGVKYY